MQKNRILLLVAALAILVPASAFAAGFGYYEQGAKATGMAGAFVAQADDASAIFYNPAGIAFLEGTNLLGAFHPVKPSSNARVFGTSTDGETPWLPPASAFAVTDLMGFKAGVGVFAPYGLEVKWPKNWIGSALTQRVYMRTIFVRPTLAFKASEKFAIGVGLDYVHSKLTLVQQSNFSIHPLYPSGRLETEINADGTGLGFTVGALAKVSDNFQIGAKYQHEVEIEYEGDAEFNYMASGHPLVDGTAAALFVNQGGNTTISMPWEMVVGAMFKPSENLKLEVDLQYTGWESFDKLVIGLDNPMLVTEDESNWENSMMVRVGAEYQVAREWAVRGGYVYDESPIMDAYLKPILPDANRNEVTFGVGYSSQEGCCWGRLTVDTAIQYLMFDDRTSTFAPFPATYENSALILGVSVGLTLF